MRGDFMLLQFRAKNYKSIGDEIIFDMTAINSLSDHKDFLIERNGVNILPVAALFGANASGKSNVLEGFEAMRNNLVLGSNMAVKTIPFLYDENRREEPTEFEVFFTSYDREYRYGYKLKDNLILEEWLYKRKLSKNKTIWQIIFEREEQRIEYSPQKKYSYLSEYNHLIDSKMLVLSFFGNRDLKNIDDFNRVSDFFIKNLIIDSTSNISVKYFLQFYYDDAKMKDEALRFLQEYDSSIEDFTVEARYDKNGEEVFEAYTKHNGKTYPLDIESSGTQKLAYIYMFIYVALKNGGIIVIDELDCQLHPLILRKIVQMFHDKNVNKKNAQLIFSSHNLIILDKNQLRRDEIWFVEKKDNGYTNLFSLAEFKTDDKHIRSDVDYGKHYLAGRFGAIPYLNDKEV